MNQYRQGDVPIVPVASIPATAVEVPRTGAKTILAYGEVTGHTHRFESSAATMLRDSDGAEYLRVDDVALVLHPVSVEDEARRDVQMVGGQIVRFSPADFASAEIAMLSSVALKLKGAMLVHEEHHGIVIAPGTYSLPGQYEYTSAMMPAIRVAD
jgi:hypothetical protein